MSATRTKNYMNWTGVTVTPAGGQAITITEVTEVNPDLDSTHEKAYGDNRRFAKCIRETQLERMVSITTGDVATANTIPVNTPCTITATLNDAFNGAGTGAITYTFKNAVLKSNKVKGANNKFAEATLEFDCFGDDSSAYDSDPFSFAVAQ